ncbi:MAG: hypothetical protein HYU36_06690 [Planctomycetes bacterium]|nr:hypothetical protein [Planctomycetota bacterium]
MKWRFVVLPLLVFAPTGRADEAGSFQVECEELDGPWSRVSDPLASGKAAIALSLEKNAGSFSLDLPPEAFAPGRYSVTLRVRSPRLNEAFVAFTLATLTLVSDDGSMGSRDLSRWSFSTPGDYEDFSITVVLRQRRSLSFTLSWVRAKEAAAQAAAGIAPTAPEASEAAQAAESGSETDPGVLELEVGEIRFPCLLADRVSVVRIGGDVLIERARPQKVHAAPGEANPIEVAVLNLGDQPRSVLVRAEVVAGMDERSPAGEKAVDVPGGERLVVRIDHSAGPAEYGREVRTRLFEGDRQLDEASEYFSVSRNIWQVSIQAPGFLEWIWARRPGFLEEKVEGERSAYMNVSEAFSWAPCSFSDLTPDTEEWWTGQNAYHSTLGEGRRWIRLSHENGMKMITYSWPSACGPIGMEFARRHPDWISNQAIGLGMDFKVRDLRWQQWANGRGKPFLAMVGRTWHSAGIDRGQLAALDFGAEQILRSATQLGWDGVRFDMPWRWSAMGGEGVHREFEALGASEEARTLFPDLFGKKETWTGDEVSYRNIRWAKHRILKAHPGFVFSYNYGADEAVATVQEPRAFAEACAGGGQIMDEAIRHYHGTWLDYGRRILRESDLVRARGGHFLVVAMDSGVQRLSELDYIYMRIFTLAGRAHPYNDYRWDQSPTGRYAQFATRYGEWLWHPDFVGLPEASKIFQIESPGPIWYADHAARRESGGKLQIVLHLITEPPSPGPFRPAAQVPARQKDVRVTFLGIGDRSRVKAVHAFSPEPGTRSLAVRLEETGGRATAVVPEHHYWTLLVWEVE